jgi:phenylalanyl-tRNA synthetase beta chain
VNASLRWLNDFLETELTAVEVRDILTARAATVEGMAAVREDLSEIVIARVVEAERHPDAEKLWLTKVDAGSGELLQVVCGAPSVEVGQTYPFAPVGATLPGGIRIEKRKIRGQLSNGMLCSARELGLGTDHTGILALNTDAAPGAGFLSASGAGDVRFDIDVLPNRPDLLSHEGLARELAAARGHSLRAWSLSQWVDGAVPAPAARRVEREGTTAGVRVRIDDVDGCPRYVGTVIRGVRVGPSPAWLVERLEGAGVRSINNVVDTTNFMLHGFGQPMHAFDLARLDGEVVIRDAAPGEKLVTLDGIERTLQPGMTVIAGGGHGQAIAGVMGGAGSEVTDATTDIFLETAVFSPRRVRATRKALAVSTDASYRFERHVDEDQVAARAALAAQLIVAVAGGEIATDPVDVYPGPRQPVTVMLRPARVSAVLGTEIAPPVVGELLEAVGFTVHVAGDGLRVSVPSWRSDAVAEIDLIEEIARLRGYDSFPSELRPFRPTTVPDDPMVAVEQGVRAALVQCGLLETRAMPFVAGTEGESLPRLRNPLAENEAWLRGSVLETLVRRAEHNLAHMARSIRLFEIGTVFRAATGPRPEERTHVAGVLMGHAEPPHFTNAQPRSFAAWDIKWIAEVVAKTVFASTDIKFNISSLKAVGSRGNRPLWIIEAGGITVGEVSLLTLDSPAWASSAFGFEIDLTAARRDRSPPVYRPLPTTPAAEIDIALIVPDAVTAAEVENAIRRHGGDILESAKLFDEFRGPGVDPQSRSLAWRLTFRHPDRTLRDREIEARKEKLVSALVSELGVRPRTG